MKRILPTILFFVAAVALATPSVAPESLRLAELAKALRDQAGIAGNLAITFSDTPGELYFLGRQEALLDAAQQAEARAEHRP